MARENAPAIIFIDEVDAIATKRFDAQTGADREVQRILMELLTQMDGFDQSVNVKVIMCTNRADTLDPALLRPGRLDRKIEFPQPGRREKRLIFQANCLQRRPPPLLRRHPAPFPTAYHRPHSTTPPHNRTPYGACSQPQRSLPLQVLTAPMNLSDDVDLEDYVSRPEKISGAEISCIVQEAGMQAVRNNRYVVLPKDFEKGYKSNTQKNDTEFAFYR